jgi:hypothetical protein
VTEKVPKVGPSAADDAVLIDVIEHCHMQIMTVISPLEAGP